MEELAYALLERQQQQLEFSDDYPISILQQRSPLLFSRYKQQQQEDSRRLLQLLPSSRSRWASMLDSNTTTTSCPSTSSLTGIAAERIAVAPAKNYEEHNPSWNMRGAACTRFKESNSRFTFPQHQHRHQQERIVSCGVVDTEDDNRMDISPVPFLHEGSSEKLTAVLSRLNNYGNHHHQQKNINSRNPLDEFDACWDDGQISSTASEDSDASSIGTLDGLVATTNGGGGGVQALVQQQCHQDDGHSMLSSTDDSISSGSAIAVEDCSSIGSGVTNPELILEDEAAALLLSGVGTNSTTMQMDTEEDDSVLEGVLEETPQYNVWKKPDMLLLAASQKNKKQKTPSWERLRASMKQSRVTQDMLQEHDRKQGLPRSHCVTMMHTNRSRRQLEEGRILPKWNGKPLISQQQQEHKKSQHRKKQTTARAA